MKAIDKMHKMFGKSERLCKDCNHLSSYTASRKWYKCDVYGVSCCASSDWRLKWQACGMFNRPYEGKEIRLLRIKQQQDESPIAGQMIMVEV